ncbi:hypothetical protein HN51_033734, partial [Arachis hypogaea]
CLKKGRVNFLLGNRLEFLNDDFEACCRFQVGLSRSSRGGSFQPKEEALLLTNIWSSCKVVSARTAPSERMIATTTTIPNATSLASTIADVPP